MVGLLRVRKYEDNDARMGRVAEKKTPSLHLEAMEESQDKSEESNDVGNVKIAST